MIEPTAFTAYASDFEDGWTVWDHIKDQAVGEGIPQADAVQLAERLEREYWAR